MRKEIFEVLYKYAIELKSKKETEEKIKNKNQRKNVKKYELKKPSCENLQKIR